MTVLMGGLTDKLRRLGWWFWGLLAAAIALRIWAFDAYSFHHPDETIQYLEQAHRIVFGYGVVPWEFRYFIRSWLIPLALVPPMQLGEWLDPGGTLYLVLARASFAALNLGPIIAAWVIGARQSRQHAIVAMAVMAVWVECVLFSVQTLSESLAVSCFFVAAALLHRQAGMRAIVIAGAMLGIAAIIRFPYAPALATYALLLAGREWRMWKGLMIGGGLALAGGALLDLAMGLTPYQWIWTNYRLNIGEQRMLKIGGHSTWTYAEAIYHYWKAALPVIILLAAIAWKRHWPLLVAAAVNIAVHQLIGHKEYRYLWLSVQVMVLIAAFGSVELARYLASKRGRNGEGLIATGLLVFLWAEVSLALALHPAYRVGWRISSAPSRLAAKLVVDPKVCGLAVPGYYYTRFGYALLHQPKPLFLLGEDRVPSLDRPGRAAVGFNAMLVPDVLPRPQGFPIRGPCVGGPFDRVCVYRREGGCTIDARSRPFLFQERLNAEDM